VPLYPAVGGAVTVRKNSGANVGTRGRLNLIEGGGITLTVADDAGGGEIDVTIQLATAQVYTLTGVDTDRTVNVDAMTVNELGNVLGTLIQDLGLV